MASHMTPDQMLEALSRQHAELRERIERCEQLAEDFEAGLQEPSQLLHEVTALRVAFDAHNQFEERALSPLLLDVEWLGAVRVSRMVEDHVEEHRAIRRELEPTTAYGLRAVLASLRTHLDAEERYLLTPKVVRDDLAG
jgi:hypothetical protein